MLGFSARLYVDCLLHHWSRMEVLNVPCGRYDCYLGIDHMEGIDGRNWERVSGGGGSIW
jgi:hypothetical protein